MPYNEQLPLPDKISFHQGEKPHEKVFSVEPFYKGYGTTIGNALRRVLLSSLTGAAITEVRIKGADHEFSTLPGVKEDVVDIILNLKKLRFKVHSDEPVRLTLKAKGKKKITAKDFDENSDVEVVTPDYPVATLSSKDDSFEMEVVVQKGKGYVPVEAREKEQMEIGAIAVDAIYSPVTNVGMDVSSARVGQDINYDKLVLTIETDGTITPEEAVEKASRILIDHFSLFANGPDKDEPAEEKEEEGEDEEKAKEKKTKGEKKKEEKK